RDQGQFAAGLPPPRRGPEGGGKRPHWPHPSAARVEECERPAAPGARPPALLQGESPRSPPPRPGLARLGPRLRALPGASAGFYAQAFRALPDAAELRTGYRYNAACSAALAGCGKGKHAAELGDEPRARLRGQALDWLKADLAAWSALLDEGAPQARTAA